jgi:Domain of unknown function (DUF4142)
VNSYFASFTEASFIQSFLMKTLYLSLLFTVLSPAPLLYSTTCAAQSSKSAAQYDAECIAGNISDVNDLLFLSQDARDRAGNARTKEVAEAMYNDYTTVLYSMEQLAVAGSGSSKGGGTNNTAGTFKQINQMHTQLSALRGLDYDTLWLADLVGLQQSKYDQLLQQKQNATNSQLKMAVTEAIPVFRRYISQLKSLQKSLTRMMLQEKKEAEKLKSGKKR